jgi:predicted AlkP superfamily phosphohydrolase/phosphomutase
MDMPTETKGKPRALVIGLDGATLDLVKPWADEGKLPTLSRLMERGAWGALRSTVPPVTAPAWTSFMTGKNPGRHGIFDFIELKPGTYDVRYTNGGTARARSLWRILGDSGLRVGVVNVPMTYPPEEVNGYLISGLDTPDEESDFIRPAGLARELKERLGGVRLDIRHLGYMNDDGKRDAVLKAMGELEEHRAEVVSYLMETRPVDFLMVVFNATDQVQHHFWHYMDPAHPQYDAGGAARYGAAILDIYRKVDSLAGRLISALPEDASVIVMSDHGAGPMGKRYLHLNRYLADIGVLAFKEKKGRDLAWLRRMDGFVRSNISPGAKMRLNRLFPSLRGRMESYSAMSMIDWEKTRAFAVEISGTSPNIWINAAGSMPRGTVGRGREYDELVDYIIEKIYEIKDPATGGRFVKRAYRRAEVYEGPSLASAPDIILSWWDSAPFVVKPSPLDGPPVAYGSGPLRGGSEWSGTHRLEGMTILNGPAFKAGHLAGGAGIADIAPTILHVLGVPVPDDMDGRVMVDALRDGPAVDRPIDYQKGAGPPGREGAPYTDDEAVKVHERLSRLGYMD